MKRIGAMATVMAMLCFAACVGKVSAQGKITAAYNVEQAQGNAPVVKVYINGKKITGENDFSAKVSGADFEQDRQFFSEEVEQFGKSREGIHYIILLDNSMSVDKRQFQQAKKELVKLRQGLSGYDRLNLYTVGSDHSKGEKKRVVRAEGKENCRQQLKQIQSIQRTKRKTVLYRSLTQVLETVDNGKMRTVVLLITDGEDDSQGKNNRTYQVNPAVKNSKVPIYGILLKNISNHPDRRKMHNTRKNILEEKISRGYYEDCGSAKDVASGFRNIHDILYKETYIVKLREEHNSNRITSDARLSILCGNQEINLKKSVFAYNQIGEKDTEAPVIKEIEKSGDNSIKFMIQDNRTDIICGAGERQNYTVKDSAGDEWKIDKVNVDTLGNKVELLFKDNLYSGDYTIRCQNITDDSQEQNAVTGETKFYFKGLNGSVEKIKRGVRTYWWAGLISIVIILGILILLLLRKKQAKVIEVDAESLVRSDSKLIGITVTDKFGSTRDIEWNVEGSIFVGRSDICELYFDDEMLSKQHFAIEVTKVACYIEDLETTNGTLVNGVKISGRRMLSDGDIITAGMERFIFHAAKNKGGGRP